MYESPVNVMEIQEPIIKQFIKEREEMVLEQIWNIGIDVNKEELIKALQYDREQYSKGYSDGYAKGIDEFAERLEELFKYESAWGKTEYHQRLVIDISEIYRIAEEMRGAE